MQIEARVDITAYIFAVILIIVNATESLKTFPVAT